MKLENCVVSTEYEYYPNVSEDEPFTRDSAKRYFIKIEIPLPGGKAIYNIPTTNEIINHIEASSNLFVVKK